MMSILPKEEVRDCVGLLEGFLDLEPGSVVRKTDWYKEDRPQADWFDFDGWEYVEGDISNKAWWRVPFCRVKVFKYNGDYMYVYQFSKEESVVHSYSGTTDDTPSSFEEKFDERPRLDRWIQEKIDTYRSYNEIEKRVGTDIPNYRLFLNKKDFLDSVLSAVDGNVETDGNPILEFIYPGGVLNLVLVGEWLENEWFVFHQPKQNKKTKDNESLDLEDLFGDIDGVFGEDGFNKPLKIEVDKETVKNFLETMLKKEKQERDIDIDELKQLENHIEK